MIEARTESEAGAPVSEPAGWRPRIGITIGDPSGIGPEVTLKAVASPEVLEACIPVIIGDAQYLAHWARVFNLTRGLDVIQAEPASLTPLPPDLDSPVIYNLNNIPGSIEMGKEQAVCGRAAAEFIEAAARLCQMGELDAITTAPINKSSLYLGGYPFPGHTELLAHLTATEEFAMTFIAPGLRVALLTTHLSLAEAIKQVRKPRLESLIRLVHREFLRYGFDQPRIAVAALNPHGGEGGLFGFEEAAEMIPAIESCRLNDDINVSGPFAGDTIFLRAARGEFDVVVSCYHDQGLIPVKCLSFGEAVNVTIGLPFIRTSVDHGTAFDIAGQGKADHSSMVIAIRLAADFVRRSKQGASAASGE
ncbi:MAG TPA: 4-hydroxythreonine-4-phosphate dehydrogenase PdxA [Blastocatellia bacterium]|nr:4-hydroxythreonine-4-phosphate dehydrogenase PdxA [Blastocatellia bacterium]